MKYLHQLTVTASQQIVQNWLASVLSLVMVIAGANQLHAEPPRLDRLRILAGDYPSAFFFRQCEGMAAGRRVSYAQWERTFDRLMGIIGKTLDEEVLGRESRNPEFFTRFKQRHPDQLVLLHFNGNARDPRWHSDRFFAGHWLYYNGARILADVPAESGYTDIRVDDPRLFRVNMGRYRGSNEDIGLCELDATGRPNWHESEQVQLVSVDVRNKTIRVRRGCYGTKPRAFRRGKSYAAAHMTEGPWGARNNIMWFYNYSTHCPLDGDGYSCSDILADHLAELFAADGKLAAFDGLEFDVLKHRCGHSSRIRSADCDADGKPDNGIINGLNTYGVGVVEFCRKLRNHLGDDRLILADGMAEHNQRAFGTLNGIESEGWPHLRDHEITDWSGGLNRHFFWDRNARHPRFTYINHKFKEPTDKPGVVATSNVPYSTHRLVFAAAVFTDSALCYSYAPPSDPDGLFGVWDEFRMGTGNKLGGLGKPVVAAVRVADRGPDLLEGAGVSVTSRLTSRFSGKNVEFYGRAGAMEIRAADPNASQTAFMLSDIPCNGPDLFIRITARADSMRGYPAEIARLAHVGIAGRPARRFMTFLNEHNFDSTFYFSGLTEETVDLEFTIESGEPVLIHSITAHAHPDAVYRRFQHGLVLANPGSTPYTFDLAELFPNGNFCRIQGTNTQDPTTNNGLPVGDEISLGAKDAIFLADG